MGHVDLVIIGGGQAGLATAHAARRAGLASVVLEAGDEPVGSWPRYYDSLLLFSPARFSELPGMRFGGTWSADARRARRLPACARAAAGRRHTDPAPGHARQSSRRRPRGGGGRRS